MSKKEIRELTKAELEVMQILWDKGEAFVSELLERCRAASGLQHGFDDRTHPRKERGGRLHARRQEPPLPAAGGQGGVHAQLYELGDEQLFRQFAFADGFVLLREGGPFGARNRAYPGDRPRGDREEKRGRAVAARMAAGFPGPAGCGRFPLRPCGFPHPARVLVAPYSGFLCSGTLYRPVFSAPTSLQTYIYKHYLTF